jgi:cation-transporting ATPase E
VTENKLDGLTEQEASARRRKGQGNNVNIQTGRSYADIVRQNVFNFINNILFVIGAVMVAIGRVSDAIFSVGLIFVNIAIGVFQEVRAKRQLDRIALLTRPKVTVKRDGQPKIVDPSELVIGDIVVCEPGDQIVVDGVVVGSGKIEVDESQLTGESDLIPKTEGMDLFSGSFVVTGKAHYEATRVGTESFANKLTAQAKAFQARKTPLQSDIDFIVRLLMLLAAFIGVLLLMSALINAVPLMRSVQMAAVIAGLIPNGLFLMVIVAYAMGALRIVNQGILIQQANSVESLSNVSVLCMDKTGTLTANKINYHDLQPLGMEKTLVEKRLADFASSATVTNKTSEAVLKGLPGTAHKITDEVPFSSARKWSALAFDDETLHGVYALGALEMLQPYLKPGTELSAKIQAWSDLGLRVLVFAYNASITTLHDNENQPVLPELTPLAIVSFSDELRPHLKETLQGFINAGVQLKIISGDNPSTVAALAKQAGFTGDLTAVSGTELAAMSSAEFEEAAQRATVFGRITPEQKEMLVTALKTRGAYVAMMGDGVNDVLSLKKANLGIAMESGSAATRGVADMILLNDSFSALPPAFLEGQRIVNGMQDILRLFLTRALYVALLIFSLGVINLGFPYLPKHVTLLTFFTVAIPTLLLAVWARPGRTRQRSLVVSVFHFVFPAAVSIFIFGLVVYVGTFIIMVTNRDYVTVTEEEIQAFVEFTGINYDLSRTYIERDENDIPPQQWGYILERALLTSQTALLVFTVYAGLMLVIFVEPPTHWWVGGDVYSGDWRPTLLALGLMVVFSVICVSSPMLRAFEMARLPLSGFAGIIGMTILWIFTIRAAWRGRWLERFLNIEPLRPEIDLSPDAEKKAAIMTQQVKAITLS